jgi:beta-lactamase class A
MFSFAQPVKGVVQKKVPLYFVLIAALLPIGLYLGITLLKFNGPDRVSAAIPVSGGNSQSDTGCDLTMKQYRLRNSSLSQPLLMTDLPNEDAYLKNLKGQISDLIAQKENSGDLLDASVYLRQLNDGSWMNINSNMKYAPGSMLKVAILITYLKMQEYNPGLFEKTMVVTPQLTTNKIQYVDEYHLPPGKYTVKELLEAMIVKSDNIATMLLNDNINQATIETLFTDLGLKKPVVNANVYPITAAEFSRFFRILFNSTYLNQKNSEFALELLMRTEYRNGILKGLPENMKVAHKFGESGDGSVFELHESALVYLENKPYLLIIMTRGKDISKLPSVLQEVSGTVYNFLKTSS